MSEADSRRLPRRAYKSLMEAYETAALPLNNIGTEGELNAPSTHDGQRFRRPS